MANKKSELLLSILKILQGQPPKEAKAPEELVPEGEVDVEDEEKADKPAMVTGPY